MGSSPPVKLFYLGGKSTLLLVVKTFYLDW